MTRVTMPSTGFARHTVLEREKSSVFHIILLLTAGGHVLSVVAVLWMDFKVLFYFCLI